MYIQSRVRAKGDAAQIAECGFVHIHRNVSGPLGQTNTARLCRHEGHSLSGLHETKYCVTACQTLLHLLAPYMSQLALHVWVKTCIILGSNLSCFN